MNRSTESAHLLARRLGRRGLTLIITAFLTIASVNNAQAQEDLVYVAVEPCRVADTRDSSEGVIQADTIRNFRVAGSSGQLSAQGGIVNCQNPREEEPVAAAVYVIAVRTEDSGNGNLFAFPSDEQPGQGSTVNFRAGNNIGNTTIVSLCSGGDCPAGGELGILSNFSEQHAIIDVQGYFYPQDRPTIHIASKQTTANQTSDGLEVECPDGTQIISGGAYSPGANLLAESYPEKAVSGSEAWTARLEFPGEAQFTVIAVCVSGFNPTIVLPTEDAD